MATDRIQGHFSTVSVHDTRTYSKLVKNILHKILHNAGGTHWGKKAIILNEKDTGQNYVSSANELTLAVESGNSAVFS